MHHFHAITLILLLFQELCPEKRANNTIMPCITFTPFTPTILLFRKSRLEQMVNPAITPTAGGASFIVTPKSIRKRNLQLF